MSARPFLIDAHAHICFSAYKDDADAVIARAEDEGIWQIAVGSQVDTSRRAVEYADRYPHIWAAVGLHPIHLEDVVVDEAEVGGTTEEVRFRSRKETFNPDAYRALAQHPKVVAIGECGMDFYHSPTEKPFSFSSEKEKGSENDDGIAVRGLQEEVFRRQISLAQECGLPMIVHVRDGGVPTPSPDARAGTGRSPSLGEGEKINHFPTSLREGGRGGVGAAHEETIRILESTRRGWGMEGPFGLIHCYTGTWEQAQRYLALGFNISFTGIITFRPTKKQLPIAEELWRTVRGVPMDRFHVETDCPYLTPEPHRGERNEPRFVRHVAEKVAELRGIPFEEVAAASVANTLRLFRKMIAR